MIKEIAVKQQSITNIRQMGERENTYESNCMDKIRITGWSSA